MDHLEIIRANLFREVLDAFFRLGVDADSARTRIDATFGRCVREHTLPENPFMVVFDMDLLDLAWSVLTAEEEARLLLLGEC